jgi:hypothetical protein
VFKSKPQKASNGIVGPDSPDGKSFGLEGEETLGDENSINGEVAHFIMPIWLALSRSCSSSMMTEERPDFLGGVSCSAKD